MSVMSLVLLTAVALYMLAMRLSATSPDYRSEAGQEAAAVDREPADAEEAAQAQSALLGADTRAERSSSL